MRQGPNGRRPRGRHHGGGHQGGGNGGAPRVHGGGGHGGHGGGDRPRSAASLRHQNFDSNCNDLRVRGNAWQVHEKYQALARDAQSSGDRVAAEHYQQHAEHYYRIIEAINEATATEQRSRGGAMPATPYGQQPETPANYYGAEGVPPVTAGAQPDGATQPMAQAEVQVRQHPQPQPNPLFGPEDDAADGPVPLVANR